MLVNVCAHMFAIFCLPRDVDAILLSGNFKLPQNMQRQQVWQNVKTAELDMP